MDWEVSSLSKRSYKERPRSTSDRRLCGLERYSVACPATELRRRRDVSHCSLRRLHPPMRGFLSCLILPGRSPDDSPHNRLSVLRVAPHVRFNLSLLVLRATRKRLLRFSLARDRIPVEAQIHLSSDTLGRHCRLRSHPCSRDVFPLMVHPNNVGARSGTCGFSCSDRFGCDSLTYLQN